MINETLVGQTNLRAIGNSRGFTIPAEALRCIHARKGEKFDVRVSDTDTILLKRLKLHQASIDTDTILHEIETAPQNSVSLGETASGANTEVPAQIELASAKIPWTKDQCKNLIESCVEKNRPFERLLAKSLEQFAKNEIDPQYANSCLSSMIAAWEEMGYCAHCGAHSMSSSVDPFAEETSATSLTVEVAPSQHVIESYIAEHILGLKRARTKASETYATSVNSMTALLNRVEYTAGVISHRPSNLLLLEKLMDEISKLIDQLTTEHANLKGGFSALICSVDGRTREQKNASETHFYHESGITLGLRGRLVDFASKARELYEGHLRNLPPQKQQELLTSLIELNDPDDLSIASIMHLFADLSIQSIRNI